jgi:hypothetical protein
MHWAQIKGEFLLFQSQEVVLLPLNVKTPGSYVFGFWRQAMVRGLDKTDWWVEIHSTDSLGLNLGWPICIPNKFHRSLCSQTSASNLVLRSQFPYEAFGLALHHVAIYPGSPTFSQNSKSCESIPPYESLSLHPSLSFSLCVHVCVCVCIRYIISVFLENLDQYKGHLNS